MRKAGVGALIGLLVFLGCAPKEKTGEQKTGAAGGGAMQKAGDEKVNPVDGAVMVWVPGTGEACANGKFRMGSTPEEIDGLWAANGWDAEWKQYTKDEQPAHEVELDGFWLYKHEVTVGQYAKFMGATGHEAPGSWDEQKGQADLPVVFVSWEDAEAYCTWAGGLLPTEAQWEYAARGPEGRLYPWGNEWDRTRCNSAEYHAGKALNTEAAHAAWFDGLTTTAPALLAQRRAVGSFPSGVSWCGALDMAGNVWEWCRDWYEEGFYATPDATQKNPECSNKDSNMRVLRGGCWYDWASFCRSTYRCWIVHVLRGGSHFGFRAAQTR